MFCYSEVGLWGEEERFGNFIVRSQMKYMKCSKQANILIQKHLVFRKHSKYRNIVLKGGQSNVLHLVVIQIDVSDKLGSLRCNPVSLQEADISSIRSLLFFLLFLRMQTHTLTFCYSFYISPLLSLPVFFCLSSHLVSHSFRDSV